MLWYFSQNFTDPLCIIDAFLQSQINQFDTFMNSKDEVIELRRCVHYLENKARALSSENWAELSQYKIGVAGQYKWNMDKNVTGLYAGQQGQRYKGNGSLPPDFILKGWSFASPWQEFTGLKHQKSGYLQRHLA